MSQTLLGKTYPYLSRLDSILHDEICLVDHQDEEEIFKYIAFILTDLNFDNFCQFPLPFKMNITIGADLSTDILTPGPHIR
jgi:hypothetical protein